MDEDIISVENIPVSFLEPFPKNTDLLGDELFIVSQPVLSSDEQIGFVSKSVRYDTVVQNTHRDLSIGDILSRISTLESELTVAPTFNSLPGRKVISSIVENNRGQIISVGGYELSDAVSSILSVIVLPKISALESPWVRTSSVVSIPGDSETLVASQKLATDAYNDLTTYYVISTRITDTMGNGSGSQLSVASQYLANRISAAARSRFIPRLSIATDLEDPSDERVASQSLVSDISNTIDSSFVRKSDVVSELGDSEEEVASQKLISDISSAADGAFVPKSEENDYVRTSQVVNTPGLGEGSLSNVASQALVSQMWNLARPVGRDGEVYYFTSSGEPRKQTILNIDAFVCESDFDITQSMAAEITMKDVFSNWQMGGNLSTSWYGYTANYYGGVWSGVGHWRYVPQQDSIMQLCNTTDYSYFTSQFKTDRYRLSARIYSTWMDDDFIGFIAAFSEDISGNPHTLSFLRTTNRQNAEHQQTFYNRNHWTCVVDFMNNIPMDGWLLSDALGSLLASSTTRDGTDQDIDKAENENGPWNSANLSNGFLLDVERNGNVISARISDRNYNMDANMQFTVDLDNMTVNGYDIMQFPTESTIPKNFTRETLESFRGPQKIGFSTISQESAMIQIKKLDVEKIIIDARNNGISAFYGGELRELDANAMQYVGIGRLAKNMATNKTFFVGQNGFVKFCEYYG